MLTPAQVLAIANKEDNPQKEAIARYRAVYYGISLHTLGAAPSFKTSGGAEYTPANYYGKPYQELFQNVLLNKHPRESEKTRNYRYSQYKPFTKGPFNKLIESVVGGIFQDNNWNLEISNDADREYLEGNNFDGYDLVSYFAASLRRIIEDPNGFFVCMPAEAYNATSTADIRPQIHFIPSTDLLYRDGSDVIFAHAGSLWWVTRQAIFRLLQSAEDQQYRITTGSAYYAHLQGVLPIEVAGGEKSSLGFFESYVDKAKAWADEFIGAKSAEQLVDKEASHPFIVQAQTECPVCNGSKQVQEDCPSCPGGKELVSCTDCRGTGWISNNPGERLLVPPDQMDKKHVDIISPNTSINELHGQKTDKIYEKLLDELNLLKVDASQSGVAKTIDLEKFYIFISKISNDLFDRLIYKMVGYVLAYRNVVATENGLRPQAYNYTIVKPQQFSIKTAMDLLGEYEGSVKAQLPAVVRERQLIDFAGKQFGGDQVQQRKTKLAVALDPLCVYTAAEQQMKALSGAVDLRDVQFSTRMPYLLSKILRERGQQWFLETDIDTFEVEVRLLFNKLFPESTGVLTDPLNGA
ncbi:MAG: hypothetical protein EOP52_13480 [Sphingobacteriales bacterium]|nr:MAG: hypothetical protein EOP52_13480 [Sphingobacteriales bacterium]